MSVTVTSTSTKKYLKWLMHYDLELRAYLEALRQLDGRLILERGTLDQLEELTKLVEKWTEYSEFEHSENGDSEAISENGAPALVIGCLYCTIEQPALSGTTLYSHIFNTVHNNRAEKVAEHFNAIVNKFKLEEDAVIANQYQIERDNGLNLYFLTKLFLRTSSRYGNALDRFSRSPSRAVMQQIPELLEQLDRLVTCSTVLPKYPNRANAFQLTGFHVQHYTLQGKKFMTISQLHDYMFNPSSNSEDSVSPTNNEITHRPQTDSLPMLQPKPTAPPFTMFAQPQPMDPLLASPPRPIMVPATQTLLPFAMHPPVLFIPSMPPPPPAGISLLPTYRFTAPPPSAPSLPAPAVTAATIGPLNQTSSPGLVQGVPFQANKQNRAKGKSPPHLPNSLTNGQAYSSTKQPALVSNALQAFLQDLPKMEELIETGNILTDFQSYSLIAVDIQAMLSKHSSNAKVLAFGAKVSGAGYEEDPLRLFVTEEGVKRTSQSVEKLFDLLVEFFTSRSCEWQIEEQVRNGEMSHITVRNECEELSCELSFASEIYHANTQLIRYFTQTYPICQKLCYLVHSFIKLTGCDFEHEQYLVVLLVIFYLQVEGVLPSVAQLQADVEEAQFCNGWQINFQPKPASAMKLAPVLSDDERDLLRGICHYYGVLFNFSNSVVSPQLGMVITREDFLPENDWRIPLKRYKDYVNKKQPSAQERFNASTPMCVQDALDLIWNVAGSVSAEELDRFTRLCRMVDEFFANNLDKIM